MNRTSKVLRRLGVPVLAAVTILGGESVLAATSAYAVAPTLTITNQGANDSATDAYGGSTPDTPTAQTLTLANGPAAAQALTITVTGSATITDPGGQAAGNTLAVAAGSHTATCTTSATPGSQACKFAVHDAISEAVTATGHDQSDPTVTDATNKDHFNSLTFTNCPQNATNTTANCATQQAANTSKTYTVTYLQDGAAVSGRNITFVLSSTAQSTFVQGSGTPGQNGVIAGTFTACVTDATGKCNVALQANQNATSGNVTVGATTATSGLAPSNVTPFPNQQAAQLVSFVANATPSRLDLVLQQPIKPGSQAAASLVPGDVIQNTYRLYGGCTVASGQTNCTGSPLAGIPVTVTVSNGFVTPNCFTGGAAGAPDTGPINWTYQDCTFTTTPAANAPVGNLKNTGTSVTMTTDPNGYFTVSFGMAKDPGFDATGNVAAKVTATATGGTGTLNETNPGQTAGPCNKTGTTIGCTTAGTTWTTNDTPLNGGAVKLAWISNPAPTGDIQIGGTQDGNVLVAQTTDQFGNLVDDPNGTTDLAVTGAGAQSTFECYKDYNNSNPCVANGNAVRTDSTPNGVETRTFTGIEGSYTNPFDATGNPQQDRFMLSSGFGPHAAGEEGTQTITATYHAEVTTFLTFTASPAGNTATYSATTKDTTATTSLNYYKPVPTTFTFTSTPSASVPAGTVVTVSATVLDQKGKGIPGLTANFIRSGPQTQSGTSCSAGGAAPLTNTAGQAGFSFTCQNPSVQNVTVIISDASGNELKRSTQTITFTGSTPPPAKHAISATIHCTSPSKHHLRCVVTETPHKAGLTVTVRDSSGNFIGSAKTNASGVAVITKGGLKSGKKLKLHARVAGSATTKPASTGTSSVTIK